MAVTRIPKSQLDSTLYSVGGTVAAVTDGGTGFNIYTIGDILIASTTTALSKLADVATGSALISGGVGVAPSYGKIGLTTHVSGTLAVGNGGTGLGTLTSGNFLTASSSSSIATTKTVPAGTVLGTTDTQTLTNKTINGTNNTITGLGIAALSAITGTPSSTTYLRGDGIWSAPASNSAVVRLNVTETTDIMAGVAVANSTWTDFVPDKTFTVGSSTTTISISIGCGMIMGSAAGNTISRIVIDSASTPIIKALGFFRNVSGQFNNPFNGSGAVLVSGLAPGSHTIKTQIWCSSNMTAYCRPATISDASEYYYSSVTELGV